MRPCSYWSLLRTPILALAALLLQPADGLAQEAPQLVGVHDTFLTLGKSSGSIFADDSSATQSRATQMAWGPGPDPAKEYLYISSNTHGVRRLEYDATTGTLTNLVSVLPSVTGNGIAFHLDAQGRWGMYLTDRYDSANASAAQMSRLSRYVDSDGDGDFDGPGDMSAAIVLGTPAGGHALQQIQFLGDTLYVGSGTRTQNGALQTRAGGDAFGEPAYGGALLLIEDVTLVPTSANAAGFPAYLPDPTLLEYEQIINGIAPGAAAPLTSSASDKLRVHSSGLRNPFGLGIDRFSQIWITNNFHRVTNSNYDRLVVDATADLDSFDGPSNDDVHDQIFVAVAFGDYGYRNGNWQSDATAQAAGFYSAITDPALASQTHVFDNLDQDGASGPDLDSQSPAYNAFHDPANPVGLGPHSAVTGLDFGPGHWRARYRDHAFVGRFNGDPDLMMVHGLRYRDLVLVDRNTGDVERVVEELAGPTDVLADSQGNLLIASYLGSIWRLSPAPAFVPSVEGTATLLLVMLLVSLGGWASRRSASGT